MTTVAYNNGKLVSDSLSTIGGRRRLGAAQKIFTPGDGEEWKLLNRNVIAFGLAGRGSAVELVKQALRQGVGALPCFPAKDTTISLILLCDTGEAFHWSCQKDSKKGEDTHDILPITGPIAIGSGGTMAEALMAVGFSAKKAVKAAIKLDTSSGGPLQVFKMPKKFRK